MHTPTDLTIRLADDRDAEMLPALENSAGTLFREIPDLAYLADGEDLSVERYRELISAGATWVATEADDEPVAFLSASVESNELHIWELAVHRDLQKRGLGKVLMNRAIDGARKRGCDAVTLTTFRDVPWNAPFYSRLGFVALDDGNAGERLSALLADEADRGLDPAMRCAMRFELDRA